MIDDHHNCEDDLSDFEDYLAEFDSLLSFDSETCPVCGVNVSNDLIIQKSPFVQYKICNDENELNSVAKILESNNIVFKVEKQIDTSVFDKIKYNYIIFIPLNCLCLLQK